MELISAVTPYNVMEVKLGDVVYARRRIVDTPTPPQKVVYVGEEAFVTESPDGGLMVYRKDAAEGHFVQTERRLLVNGFEVPAPLGEDPGETRTIYAADPTRTEWYFELTRLSAMRRALAIERGLAHATSAAAAAHAKALVWINPTAQKSLDGEWKSLDDAYDNLP